MPYTIDGSTYEYRRALKANTVGLGDLTSQPLPFVGPDLTGKVLASLNDAVLTGPDGSTLLPWSWEVETEAAPVGHAQFDLTGGQSAHTAAYLYYNAPSGDPGDQTNPTGVWPASHKGGYLCNDAASPLLDATSNHANLTAYNSPTYQIAGVVGYSVGFNRTLKPWFGSTNSVLNTGQTTVALWVKCNVVDGSWETFVQRDNTNVRTVWLYRYGWTNVRFAVRLDGSESTSRQVVSDAIASTAWTHWCGTYDGTTLKLYRNGVLQTNTLNVSGLIDCDSYTQFALAGDGTTYAPFGGWLDDVRVLNTAMTADEVTALYRAGAGTLWSWGEEEAEVAQPPGPTSAHVLSVGTRAKVYGGGTTAVNVSTGTRARVL